MLSKIAWSTLANGTWGKFVAIDRYYISYVSCDISYKIRSYWPSLILSQSISFFTNTLSRLGKVIVRTSMLPRFFYDVNHKICWRPPRKTFKKSSLIYIKHFIIQPKPDILAVFAPEANMPETQRFHSYLSLHIVSWCIFDMHFDDRRCRFSHKNSHSLSPFSRIWRLIKTFSI